MHVARELYEMAEHVVNTCDRLVILNEEQNKVRFRNDEFDVEAYTEEAVSKNADIKIVWAIMRVIYGNEAKVSIDKNRAMDKVDSMATDDFSKGILETYKDKYKIGESRMLIIDTHFDYDSYIVGFKNDNEEYEAI